MSDITVCMWLWKPVPGYRSQFNAGHVNRLAELVRERCRLTIDFVCVTDCPEGIAPWIRTVPLWPDHAELPSPFRRGPSCYRRLKICAREAPEIFGLPEGAPVVSLDLDSVPVDWLDPVWDRPEDFVGWRASERAPYCGSMWMIRLGRRPHVWEGFNPGTAQAEAKAHGFIGSDQARLAVALGPHEAAWTVEDGVYSFKDSCMVSLPENARIVFFHGKPDPWDPEIRARHAWIREHYPMPEAV